MEKKENVIEKAIMFAVIAHISQVRKGDKKTPYVVHPMNVAQILIEYGADENVIAASYLHDIPEDTKFTLKDIKRIFGEDIAHLVEVCTEKDKSKSWEERKLEKIKELNNKSLREKLIPTADKIANIEDLSRNFKKTGVKDFSAFRRGEKEQEWYYRSVYHILIQNENINNPLFKRLENDINNVFGRTMQDYKKSGEDKKMQDIIEDRVGNNR